MERLRPIGAFLGDHVQHELGEVVGQVRVERLRTDRDFVQVLAQEIALSRGPERRTQSAHFEGGDAEVVDVGSAVERFALDLFGRHVGARPGHVTGADTEEPGEEGIALDAAGQGEVDDLHGAG